MRRSASASAFQRRATPEKTAAATHPSEAPTPSDAPFDWAVVGWYALLLVHAVRRHPGRLFALWFGVVASSMLLMSLLPKTYEVQTTLQVLRPAGLSSTVSDADNQTKQAALAVLQRDNLVALLRQTDFLANWPLHRAPLLKVKDAIWSVVFKKPTEAEQLDGFVGLLEKQLWVTPGDGTVTIGIHLTDPVLALHLVEAALQNFLEARHTAEITSIGEVVSILETRTGQAHEALDQALRQLQTLRTARAAKLGRRLTGMVPALATLPDPETEQLLVQVKTKRLAIADLEDFRRRHVADLEGKLEEMRSRYSETHPAVLDAEQALEAARVPSPQVGALRNELLPLETELKQRGFDADLALRNNPTREVALQQTIETDDPHEDEDPNIDFAKGQVRHTLSHYNEMLDRTADARLAEDRAGAAFKYRYIVLWPAQKPLGPFRPKALPVFAAAFVAGFVLAVLGVSFVDISSRKLMEPWQVEHALGLVTLATLSTEELTRARDGPADAEQPLLPSVEVTELWRVLRARPWTTLAIISPEDGTRAWRLAQLLVAAAGKPQRPVLKAVNLLDVTVARAGAVSQALAVGNFAESGERMRFVVASASPVASPVALSVLGVCDAVLLLLELGRSSLPEANASATLADRERLLGVVLSVE